MNVPTTQDSPAVAQSEGFTVLTVHPTAHLTEEQKTWRRLKLVPGREGEGLLVPVDTPDPVAPPVASRAVLSAVADMLATGYAGSAEAIFAKLRTSGLALKPVIGDDGVLHVTIASA